MSKRKYTHMNEYEAVILTMRQSGYTRREIADELGFSVKQIETWITRYNKRQRHLKPKACAENSQRALVYTLVQSKFHHLRFSVSCFYHII